MSELAKQAPRHKEDLSKINGLGGTFVEKYGDYFMIVLNQYHSSNISTKELNKETKATLKNLENRLVNISKRNRLLYMGRIYGKYAFDLCENEEFNKDVINLLVGRKQSLKLCKISQNNSEAEKRYKRILQLLREISKDFRENGQYDLYIGYPYVLGKTKGENFNVRAPLVLFPISYERTDDEITIKLDRSKDVLFNNNLILLQNKFLGKNDELPNNVIDEINSAEFTQQIREYYQSAGIELNCEDDVFTLKNFIDIKADEFPSFASGEFKIEPNAILGKFSLYSSALQRDFKEMIDDTEINRLLDELISGMDEVNFYTEEEYLNDVDMGDEKISSFSETNLSYINELNASQEQAILSIDQKDKLVIQGPPGTGKSQTITSLIADAVNKGHNVLMVSQKKAALDVIYSRLGTLSNFAILLSDVKNKENFYKQLYNLFISNKNINDVKQEFIDVSLGIDEQIKSLDNIAEKLYTDKTNGVEMYKIYQTNEDNEFKTKQKIEDAFYSVVPENLIDAEYSSLLKLKEKYTDKITYQKVMEYYNVFTNVPFIADVNGGLNNFAVKQMEKDFDSFVEAQKEFLKKNFIVKFFAQFNRKKELKELYQKYFVNADSKKTVFNNPDLLNEIPKEYFSFEEAKIVFDSLDSNERKYGKAIFDISKVNNEIDINDYLFDFIISSIIQNFEHKNNDVLSNIYNFNSIIKQINKSMQKKKDLSKIRLRNNLINSFYKDIYESKRYYEICRQVESSRKWSVAKFLKKFSFELFKGIRIWLMTPESVSEVLPLEKGLFDLLIFDEASQIYIEKGIPAISRARKVVIAGDHKQLRPSSLGVGRIEYNEEEEDEEDESENAALEEESLLDLARFKYPSVLLNYHYRSKYEELINFSNYAFYGGRLNVSPNIKEPSAPPIEVIKINNGLWQKRCNKNEALKVVELIKSFLMNRENNESLGVITFNSNQRDLIMDELDKECLKDKEFSLICRKEFERKENGEDFGLFIKNIENVQGDERDCIIFSLGYAKNETGKVFRNFGWLNQRGGENRLNVAITRAKSKIYIVTSVFPQELVFDDLKSEGPKIMKKYLEYCYAISNKDKDTARQILYSFIDEESKNNIEIAENGDFEIQVLHALEEEGLKVDTQVGVGDYKIDLAIRDENNNYILGIECDGKLYSSPQVTRERDIYRQKYLESRGWKIYRVWSTNWWHNPKKEIENIVKEYNSLVENANK
ncbi:MAG: DUF559 domain-containing protein [Clostridia bacterium]|nr:DUF559 domain-containing protein [Clostridia bacterium]